MRTKIPHEAEYLADAVYVWDDGYHIVLGTSDGSELAVDAVFMDPYVVSRFDAWRDRRTKLAGPLPDGATEDCGQ